ncbi:hypothetical protein [Massilia sp. NP310]|uniref:hypothetical protein n=1 Tax=Massilia sp. NP310 TaxID=2861282 RepID=UPI001E5BF7BD|nr:hypothetical protein [Massilia sp. NP310]
MIDQVALASGHRKWKMLARSTQIRAKDIHRHPQNTEQIATGDKTLYHLNQQIQITSLTT